MNIGTRLRNLRISKNLTLEEIGRLLGVSKATVNRYETGDIDIKRTTALKLSNILNVSPSYIMGWTDKIDISDDTVILDLYNKLDFEDKAEVRGTIKQMLKADKYNMTYDETPLEIAAFDGDGTKGEYKTPKREIT